MKYNIYCDESCHLPNDGESKMILGSIWIDQKRVREINDTIRSIKHSHGIHNEMKWVKLSTAREAAYLDLVNYFFDCKELHFRALVVDNKNEYKEFASQTYDDWYYKMYFHMLNNIISSDNEYNIYLDIKDTKSKSKIAKLREVLSNSHYDFSRTMIDKMQVIQSHEVEIMQVVDILIGALGYYSRGLSGVKAKEAAIDLIKNRSGYSLDKSTPLREEKMNIFHLQLSNGGRRLL
ncbi:MAG: DUF3800 domain-containing protein [Lachnospiraceae bacterium]|nr:DUF3800 domain-containing protein [Lachnospiraceae bacterium]